MAELRRQWSTGESNSSSIMQIEASKLYLQVQLQKIEAQI
jgi:hypothetical protein